MSVSTTDLVVRGAECGPGGTVPLATALGYCELGRWNWILGPELGLLDDLRRGSFFVVHRATIALERTFGLGTALTVRAALRSVGRVTCEVDQDLVRADGVRVARARITAVWLGPGGGLRRVPEVARRALTEAPLDAREAPPSPGGGTYLDPEEAVFPGELARPVGREVPDGAAERVVVVRRSDCDVHGHVNNAAWLRLFDDLLPSPAIRADVEYRGQAGPGDVLRIRSWERPEGAAFAALRARPDGADEVLCRAVLVPRP